MRASHGHDQSRRVPSLASRPISVGTEPSRFFVPSASNEAAQAKEEEISISSMIPPRRVLTSKRETVRYLLNPVNVPISVGISPLRLVFEISTVSVNIR